MTPGTQPIKVKINVMTILPHPLSYTARWRKQDAD
jgi:hypothetical protein